MKALLVIWFFSASGGNSPMVTRMESMAECQAARESLLKAFPDTPSGWTTPASGIHKENIACVEISQ